MTHSDTPPTNASAASLKQLLEGALKHQTSTQKEIQQMIAHLNSVLESDAHHLVRGFEIDAKYVIAATNLIQSFILFMYSECPEHKFTVTLFQQTLHNSSILLKLIIDGKPETLSLLEAQLEIYSQILLGQKPMNALTTSPTQIMWLKQRLDFSALEIKILYDAEHASLEAMPEFEDVATYIETVHHTVAKGLSSFHALQTVLSQLLLKEQSHINEALTILQQKLDSSLSEADRPLVEKALRTVKEHKPDLFEEIRSLLNKSSIAGKAGDLVCSWIASLTSVMPK